jgi:hypothetical protein
VVAHWIERVADHGCDSNPGHGAGAGRKPSFNVKQITLTVEPAGYVYDGDRCDCRRSTAP